MWLGAEARILSGKRVAALFKCLLSAPGHRLTREQAIELIWPEANPALASTNLRTTVHLLRRALTSSACVITDGDTISLLAGGTDQPESNWLDAEEFERRGKIALEHQDATACRIALDRYMGEYLPSDPYEAWTEPVRGRLHRLWIELLLHLARLSASAGDLDESERSLRRILEDDPVHEEAAGILMSMLSASGRGSEALRVYQSLATMLEKEPEVAPGADIETLRARIAAHHAATLPPISPSSSDTARHTNLPTALTSFVGRDWELTEITNLLAESRLVTLTGPGGCGKTRLALEVATRLLEDRADGVWVVELAGLADPTLVPQVVATALGVEEQSKAPLLITLSEALLSRDALIVVDNCEHLVSTCAELSAELLSRCPHLRMLTTSREPLGVPGEVAYRVPSLASPDPHELVPVETLSTYEAVALFEARARAIRPDFAITSGNASAVAQICARLDGLPLAIELAAARLSVLAVEGIAQRLDDRFRLLSGGPRTALPRQQTLRATMDWSHSLLAPVEQALLRRLAVFAGGCVLSAAESVCAADDLPRRQILDRLDGLIHKSLVVCEDRDGQVRYRMLETVRQYARERLEESGEESTVLLCHATYYADMAERSAPRLVDAEQAEYIALLHAELSNIRIALAWSRESGDVNLGLRLAAPLWRFWIASGQSTEGGRWLDALMEHEAYQTAPAPLRADALFARGSLAYTQSNFPSAEHLFLACLELRQEFDDLRGQAEAWNGIGVAKVEQGDYGAAGRVFAEAVRLWRHTGDAFGHHAPLSNLANVVRYQGDYSRAIVLYEEALEIQRRFGHLHAMVTSLSNLALLAQDRGEYPRATKLIMECLNLARESGLLGSIPMALNARGAIALEQGELAEAQAFFDECLVTSKSTGDRGSQGLALVNLADVALARGDPESAILLGEEALPLFQHCGQPRGQAFALAILSDAARVRGDYKQASQLLEECLLLRRSMGDALGTVVSLEARARLASSRGQNVEAIHLYGSAAALRDALEAPLPPYSRGGQAKDLAHLSQSLNRVTFEELWEEGQRMAEAYLPGN